MTAIIYDYSAIGQALKGDDWWKPTRAEVEPLPIPVFSPSLMEYLRTMSEAKVVIQREYLGYWP